MRSLPDPTGGSFDGSGDFDRLIPAADPAFPILMNVDPYGDTALESVQMHDLLAELDRLEPQARTPIERRAIQRLRALAERCRDSTDLQLWFLGD